MKFNQQAGVVDMSNIELHKSSQQQSLRIVAATS